MEGQHFTFVFDLERKGQKKRVEILNKQSRNYEKLIHKTTFVFLGVILGNTYHLGHRPGPDVMQKLGGLHEFMNYPRAMLTDR